jgi:hypothetical protein
MDFMMQAALFEAQLDCDYNPFAEDEPEQNFDNTRRLLTVATDHEVRQENTDAPKENLQAEQNTLSANISRFPNYGWRSNNFKEDCELDIKPPAADEMDVLKNTWITNARPYDRQKDGKKRSYYLHEIHGPHGGLGAASPLAG